MNRTKFEIYDDINFVSLSSAFFFFFCVESYCHNKKRSTKSLLNYYEKERVGLFFLYNASLIQTVFIHNEFFLYKSEFFFFFKSFREFLFYLAALIILFFFKLLKINLDNLKIIFKLVYKYKTFFSPPLKFLFASFYFFSFH